MKKCVLLLTVVIVIFTAVGNALASLNDGLVAYYPFNGNANDESGNGNNGTVNGATLTEDRFERTNSAYSFDGSSYIKIPHSSQLDLFPSFTICFWAVPTNGNTIVDRLWNRNNSQTVEDVFTFTASWIYYNWNGQPNHPSYEYHDTLFNISDTKWHLMCFKKEGSNISASLDGRQTITWTSSVNVNPYVYPGDWYFGTQIDNGNLWYPYKGRLDDVRIYNRALSDSEIQELYNLKDKEICNDGIDNNGDGLVDCKDPDCCGNETCTEKVCRESTLTETIKSQKAVMDNVAVSGDFTSTMNFKNLEFVTIATGAFAGKGFFTGEYETTLESVPYKGEWKGVSFLKPDEKKIYLKGATTGDIEATVEGFLTESTQGSGIYDQYQPTWKIGKMKGSTTSATIELNGTVTYQDSSEYANTELYVLQTQIERTISGDYPVILNTVSTHLRIMNEDNPYKGNGFSLISYTSESGTGECWTFDKQVSEDSVELKGLSSSPLYGIASGNIFRKTLLLNIERIDNGLKPMSNLEVTTWGPQRVSPGQTVDYVVEYRNDGVKDANDVIVVLQLNQAVEYLSSTNNGIYRLDKHEVFWKLGTIPPKSSGILTAKVLLQWGLPHVMISNIALIATNSDEVDKYLYPDKIPNLDVAAYLEYLTMITHIELTHEEFENEVLSDQQFSETFNQIIKEGYYYTDVAVRTIMDNGTIVNVALLYKNNPLELLFINQYEKEKPIIMKMGVNTISFGEKEGGVTFDFPDSNKFEISCYGNWCGELNTSNKSPDGCTTSDCVNNGLIAKLPMYIVQKVSKIISLGMDVYECIKCGQSDPPDVFNCAKCAKFVQDNLADKIPWLGEIIDLTEVITNCIKDKNKYSVPDRTIKRECKQAPEDAWKRISESNDIREWIRMPKPGKYYVAQYLFTASTCRWDLEPYADAITECKSMKNVSEICQDGNCKENLKNLDVYGLEIITAGDPNAKYGPSGAVSAGQKLDYKVEFENEGEGIAFGVYFTDTLDEDLDDSTLVIGPVKDVKTDDVIAPEGTYNPKTHTITWMVGEVGSMKGGYAEISVNVKTDAPKGTEIINYGTVYFPSVPQVTRTNAIVSKIPDKEICGNGIDDDGDGLIDCDDPDCFSQNCQEICDDGLDNDGDGFVDCADTDCEPCREICNNGLDDDRDGLVDCDDPDCTVICNCKPEQVTVKPIRLKLRKKASDELTITVRGENDCPVVGQKVITKISKAGTSRITVVPVDTVTDNNGESKFTVTALKKTGSARIFFKIGGLRISIPVKVVK